MTIYWGREIPGWLIFGLLILLCIARAFFPAEARAGNGFTSSGVTGPEYYSPLNDSMPHYQYRKTEDSLKRIQTEKDFFLQNTGSELNIGSVGVATYGKEKKQDFLTVTGYTLNEHFTTVENNVDGSLLNYPVWDRVSGDSRDGHFETKPLNIKYKAGKERWEDKVFVPINTGLGTLLTVAFYILASLFTAVALYFILFIPFRFLLRLSKGQAFTEQNIGNLYLIGWALVAMALCATLLNIISHICIKSQLPPEISFSYYAAFMKTSDGLLAGLVVLLLAKAFLQGFELKEEQDLTV
jgi:hypothetical protein